MNETERLEFLPIVRSFTNLLEKVDADPKETDKLLQQVREIVKLIPTNLRKNIPAVQGIDLSQFTSNFQGLENVRNVRKTAAYPQFDSSKKRLTKRHANGSEYIHKEKIRGNERYVNWYTALYFVIVGIIVFLSFAKRICNQKKKEQSFSLQNYQRVEKDEENIQKIWVY